VLAIKSVGNMSFFTHKRVLLPSTDSGRRLVLLIGFVCASTVIGRPAVFGHGRAALPVQSPAAGSQSPAAAQQDFDKIAADAKAASDADKLDEAIALYRKALSLRPQWPEGWWYLATILYDHDNYAEAARAFKETARLQPKAGAPWAMIGLCEFQLGHYDQAFDNIEKGRSIGVGDNVELTRVMRYHEGILALLKGEFERAQMTLGTLSYEGLKSEDLIIGLGLSVLRIGMVPKQVDLSYRDRDVIRRAGLPKIPECPILLWPVPAGDARRRWCSGGISARNSEFAGSRAGAAADRLYQTGAERVG
jgi:Flp pilus assembly protein TadD